MTVAITPARPTFWALGACSDLPADWFHPERGESTKNAKAVCRSCPVRVECLDYALTTYQKFGIWGGTSERERRRIRRRLDRGDPVPELELALDRMTTTGPDLIIISTEEAPIVELTMATPPAPTATPTNGTRGGVNPDRACDNCGKRYAPARRDQRFHSKDCARAWYSSHPKGEGDERRPRIRKPRAIDVPVTRRAPAPAPAPAPSVTPGPVDLQTLLGQLLAGCDHWTVEADLGDDVHITVSRR